MVSFLRCALGLLAAGLLAGAAVAQSSGTSPVVEEGLTLAGLEARLAALAAETGLDEAVRLSTEEALKTALEELRRAVTLASQTSEFRAAAGEASDRLRSIRDELARPPNGSPPPPPAGATLQELEQALGQTSADLEAARQGLTALQAESGRRNERRSVIPEQIDRAQRQLAEMAEPSTPLPRDGESAVLVEARRAVRVARRQALQSEIAALESELSSYDARRELLPARLDLARRRIAEAEAKHTAWQAIVTAKRIAEADQAAAEAKRLRREAARQHVILSQYAKETAERAETRAGSAGIAGQIDVTTREVSALRSDLESLRRQFASIQRRLDASGLNRATGLLLRRQYESLPEQSTLRQRIRSTQSELEDTEYRLVELQEERVGAGDIDRVAQELIARIPPGEVPAGSDELLSVARELATARRDLLDQLIADTTAHFDHLIELDTTLRALAETTASYREFIEERILWVRSISGDRLPRLADFREGVTWVVDASRWREMASRAGSFALTHKLGVGLGVFALVLIWATGVRLRRRQQRLAELVSRYRTDAFVHTLESLAITVVLAAPGAATLFSVGWLLSRPEEQPALGRAIGAGMQAAASALFLLALIRQCVRPRGLAEAHFRWAPAAVQTTRRNLLWFTPVVVTLVALVTAIDYEGAEGANATFGRVLFSALLLAHATFMFRVLRPKGPVLRRWVDDARGSLAFRLRHVWFPLIVLAPLVFVVLSWLGFHYTAMQLELRLKDSLVLVFVLMLVNGVMLRWLFIARRRVAVENARRKRAQVAAEAALNAATGGEPPPSEAPAVVDEDEVDLPALSTQTRQLFRAATAVAVTLGLFVIWAQTLPALRMLDRVQVWPDIVLLEADHSPAPLDTARLTTPPEQQPGAPTPLLPAPSLVSETTNDASDAAPLSITLADIGLAMIVLLATIAIFRNVPGLVEIVVLQRLPLDAGSRYALTTVLRYSIAIIGVLIAFNTIGLSWGKVQWLAAALTFGLAFGLQEIFANFVSGLIILAERPIRLGDTVTVGGVTGTVTRIRMRATTITDWDLKELVIPNKTFITGDVINWSLSAPSLRVTVPVGVSYSSDVDKVESLLRTIAVESQVVLSDPPPQVLFRQFGDSTLNYELRVFIPSIDHFVSVRHELHTSIIKRFRAAGIEIAFPQRDLHIRSISDLDRLAPRERSEVVDADPQQT